MTSRLESSGQGVGDGGDGNPYVNTDKCAGENADENAYPTRRSSKKIKMGPKYGGDEEASSSSMHNVPLSSTIGEYESNAKTLTLKELQTELESLSAEERNLIATEADIHFLMDRNETEEGIDSMLCPELINSPGGERKFKQETQNSNEAVVKAADVKDLMRVLEKAVRGAAYGIKKKDKKRSNKCSKSSPVVDEDAMKCVSEDEAKPRDCSKELQELTASGHADTSEISSPVCLMQLLDQHRNPRVYDIDYGDACFEEEIMFLKQEAGMKDCNLFLECQPSTSQPGSLKKCPVCDEDAKLSCKNCLSISYCCREHQKEHWKSHRPHCVLYEVTENEFYGRHLIAKTNIKVGDLILKEFPLFVAPAGPDGILKHLKFNVDQVTDEPVEVGKFSKEDILVDHSELFGPICLGCNMELTLTENGVQEREMNSLVDYCTKCGWAICGAMCPSLKNHAWECQYFREQGINYKEIQKRYILPRRVYFVIRALLIEHIQPRLWSKLMSLQSNIDERRSMEQVSGRRPNDLYIAFLLKTVFKFVNVPLEKIDTILGIMDTNGFYSARRVLDSNRPDDPGQCRKHFCVYEKGSLLSHSCVPNAIAIRMHPPSLEIIAASQIKKGDVIFIDYDYQGIIRSKCERRNLLRLQYSFNCTCRLCSDTSDDELFLGGVTCLRCRRRGFEGYFIPESPFLEDSTWKCTKCYLVKTDTAISNVVKQVSRQVYEYADSLRNLRYIVDRSAGPILHRNHYVILHAEFEMMRLLFTHLKAENRSLPVPDIGCLVSLLEKAVAVVCQLVPPCHKTVLNLKLQLVEILKIQSERGPDDAVQPISCKIQAIHDEVAQLLTEDSARNSLQAFLLMCVRLIRTKLRDIHECLRHRQNYKSKLGSLEEKKKIHAKGKSP